MKRHGPLSACRDGIGRVRQALLLVLLLWIVTLIVSVPLAIGVRRDVERHIGSSLQATDTAPGRPYDWLTAFSDQASGASASVGPAMIGFGAVVDNLSALLDWDLRPAIVGAAGVLYLLSWTFLTGGLIDRLARQRPLRAHAFFQACGGFFFALLRLSLLSAVVYGVLIGRLHPWLFDGLFDRWNERLDSERTAVLIRLALYGVFVLGLAATNLWFDYARVRLVVEDRGSAIGALRASARFIRRHGWSAIGLYLCDALLFGLVLALYAAVAPGAGISPLAAWSGFVIGQLYVAARLGVKLVFWASEIVLYQSHLAHAGYVARRLPAWPDSAAAAAVDS